MEIFKTWDQKELADILADGGVGLVPTDTIYGLSASIYAQRAVEKIYRMKNRGLEVPMIILISSISDLEKFRIELSKEEERLLGLNWPGRITFILKANKGFDYLRRGKSTLAFRCPQNTELCELLKIAGPIVSTSANLTGQKPAESLQDALSYFPSELDFCLDVGPLTGSASTLVDLSSKSPIVIRQGDEAFRL